VRFCRCCRKFIKGRQIEVLHNDQLACPTQDCRATPDQWVYPNEIAQALDRSGRRVFRGVAKRAAKLIPIPAM
jgi:hypothetical protein